MGIDNGGVIWLTGLPASGKSSLARGLANWLRVKGQAAVVLDSDRMRHILTPEPDYSEAERDRFYAALAGLAGELAAQGLWAVVAATANYLRYRRSAREQASQFVEVYVVCDEVTRRRRDSKGLYAAADIGEITNLPGQGAVFEPPISPDVVVDTAALNVTAARQHVIDELQALPVFALDDLPNSGPEVRQSG